MSTQDSQQQWWGRWIPAGFFLLTIYFPLFLHLGNEPVKNFDESLFACRAFSIAYYGEYLCNFRDLPQGPSASNTKPPLISYVQALSFYIFGYNELALRLPIAISAVLLIWVLIAFSRREFGSPTFGYICGLVLVTSRGFVDVHMSRTGDHDIPLALFGLIFLLSVYRYLDSHRTEKKYLVVLTLMLIFMALTKGIAGLFFGPGVVLYALYKRQLLPLLRDKYTWIAVGVYILAVVGFYLFRHLDCPEFLDRMWKYEMGGHYGKTRDSHDHPWYWYFHNWYIGRFPWLPLVPLGIGMMFLNRFRDLRDWGVMMLICFVTYMAVVSNSQTKLLWYDASVYPMLAFWAAWVLYTLFNGLKRHFAPLNISKTYLLGILFLIGIFVFPYRDIMQKVYLPRDVHYVPERYGHIIKETERLLPDITEYCVLHIGQSTHILFYQLIYNNLKDYRIKRYRSPESVKVGDTVMVCQTNVKNRLMREYEYEFVLGTQNKCVLLHLIRRK